MSRPYRTFHDRVDRFKRRLIECALKKTHGNITAAGRILNYGEDSGLRHYIKRHGIDTRKFRGKDHVPQPAGLKAANDKRVEEARERAAERNKEWFGTSISKETS